MGGREKPSGYVCKGVGLGAEPLERSRKGSTRSLLDGNAGIEVPVARVALLLGVSLPSLLATLATQMLSLGILGTHPQVAEGETGAKNEVVLQGKEDSVSKSG